jgi:hypothetical protein
MTRCFQILLIVSATGFSWLAMMVVHEFGHVLHAWLSGGSVARVVLHPAVLSQTILATNPHPLFVVWGGPAWGCLIPLGLLAVVRLTARSYTYLAAYFAGFCLIANGAYLIGGAFFGGTLDDAAVVLKHGGAPWQLIAFGLVTVGAGLYLWNGLGAHFGLGPARGTVDRRAALGAAAALILLIVVEIVLGG